MPLPPAPKKLADTLDSSTQSTATTAPVAKKQVKNLNQAQQKPLKAEKVVVTKSAVKPSIKKTTAQKSKHTQEVSKIFVLDTNVLMHDPTSLFRFQEHHVFITLITLEELDAHKTGTSEVARNTRQASRYLDDLITGVSISDGIPLNRLGHQDATGKLFLQTESLDSELPTRLPSSKADNQILIALHALTEKHPKKQVILVSKDINMRIKARALGLPAEDYTSDKVLDDTDLLYPGHLQLPEDFWDLHGQSVQSWSENEYTYYRFQGPIVAELSINQFVYYEADDALPLYAVVTEVDEQSVVLRTIKDYTNGKNTVWGIYARNREQNFALNALMDPEIDFVTLTGQAGTGKTLLTLAAALTQALDQNHYSEIIMTRVTVSVGEDIGFLPGTEEEKMGPWMGALDDNLDVLAHGDNSAGEWGRAATNELIRSKIKIKSLNFMRGRTFLKKFLIIDEAQNLTPKQMKTIITRAGPGTKVICMGNLNQIDTPYLTEGSSGLTYVVSRFKGWLHNAHIMLERGERSRLADFASEVL